MIECLCGRWYDAETRPARCICGQRLRLTQEEREAVAADEEEE